MNNDTQQNTENAPTHVYLTAPSRRLWRGTAGVSKVASVQEPRATRVGLTAQRRLKNTSGTQPKGPLRPVVGGLKGASEKEKELKNGQAHCVSSSRCRRTSRSRSSTAPVATASL